MPGYQYGKATGRLVMVERHRDQLADELRTAHAALLQKDALIRELKVRNQSLARKNDALESTRDRNSAASHGTYSGAIKHRRRKEPLCAPCKEAERLYRRTLRQTNNNAKKAA